MIEWALLIGLLLLGWATVATIWDNLQRLWAWIQWRRSLPLDTDQESL